MSSPLLQHFGRHAVIGWRNGTPVMVEQFLAAAHTLAHRIPAGLRCMNLCKDRLNFALGLAAAVIRGTATLLPPNHVPAVLGEVAASAGPVFCICDSGQNAFRTADLDLTHWPEASSPASNPEIADDLLAVIAFTSGTTGKPQPHGRSWRSYVDGASALRRRIDIQPGAVLVGTVPPQHMWGLEASVMLAFQSGCAIYSGAPLLPAEICDAVVQTPEDRWLVTTPVHLRALVLSGASIPRLSGVLTATAALDVGMASAIETNTQSTVFEIYGTTETGALATRKTASELPYQFLDGVAIDTGSDLPRVQGGHVHQSALLNDALCIQDDGRFTLEGRLADLIKISGKRASLAALNLELNAIPGVLDGIFYMPEQPSHNTRLSAFVVAPGVAAKDIIAALRARIDAAFLPRPLIQVRHLPRNAAGKLTFDAMAALAEQAHTAREQETA